MKKLLQFLVKSIVPHPKEVSINEQIEENLLNFIIHAHPDDLKIIIGKKGRTIKAIRELVKIKAIPEKKRINIQIEACLPPGAACPPSGGKEIRK